MTLEGVFSCPVRVAGKPRDDHDPQEPHREGSLDMGATSPLPGAKWAGALCTPRGLKLAAGPELIAPSDDPLPRRGPRAVRSGGARRGRGTGRCPRGRGTTRAGVAW